MDEELNRLVVAHSEEQERNREEQKRQEEEEKARSASEAVSPEGVPGGGGIGSVSFVSCATGEEGASMTKNEEDDKEEGEEVKPIVYVYLCTAFGVSP